ncbi:MAG: putative type restriction endonuclease [Thermococcaceae archaeon]|jgi:hypothetical protein|uniref:type I restriction endonuclease n=1 Tax=Thermococcus sp. PK TaxID=913025 RepID=UPI0005B2DCB7|nr:hypothetical protein [Thermococcus sp. PK]KUJ98503.1 MAG: Uncharacterized protein XD43_1833 [Thermococcales archaeon 44_46]MDK2854412.1 putative type restriction endonuclease [Thermococcaceae archaeon]MDN5320364.1 putative type restriction endonuclease [Thermococcaceae archaeon]
MEELGHVVRRVLDLAKSGESTYRFNEEATKQHLILPVLNALDWDVFSPEVMPEERVRGPYGYYRADYSLRVNGKTIAYLEAKSLGVDVFTDKGALHQLLMYCSTEGIDIGILTNGIRWVVLNAYESGTSLEERILLTIDLNEEAALEKLKLLSKETLTRSDFKELVRRKLEKLKQVEDKTSGIPTQSLVSQPAGLPQGAKLLDELTPEELSGRPRILELYIYHNGQWHELPVERNAWAMSLFTAVKFLWEHGFQDLYIPTYVETTYVRNPKYTDVVSPWHVYRPENGSVAVSKLKELERKTGVKIAVKVVKRA